MNYATTYKEVSKWNGNILRRNARHLVLSLISNNAKFNPDFKGVHFLFFHYIFEDEIENARLAITWIAKNFKVISYSEAVRRVKENDIDDYYICFSSDDGFKNNLVSAQIFKEFDISCCYFINPTTITNKDLRFQKMVCEERYSVPLTEVLNWQDVEQLLNEGHEIGNHTYDHKEQASLNREEFMEDLSRSHEALQAKVGSVIHYAYPRGKFIFFKKEYLKMVYDFGYESCGTGVRGCHLKGDKIYTNQYFAFRRELVVFKEPLSFLQYFMSKSQRNAKLENNFWEIA